jgi:uncharacterized membrane protein
MELLQSAGTVGVDIGTVMQLLVLIAMAIGGWYARQINKRVNDIQETVQENSKARRVLFGESLNGESTEGFREEMRQNLHEARKNRQQSHAQMRRALASIQSRLQSIESELTKSDVLDAEFESESDMSYQKSKWESEE